MTPEERQMLTDLANKVAQTAAPPIDKDAEEFIRTRIGSRPDALYLMTQTVLIQNMALEQAKQQIQQLQQQQGGQTAAGQSSSSFLGGRGSTAAPPPQAPNAPPPTYQMAPAPGSGSSGGGFTSGGGGSFLRGAAQTAAGVAAGALAFEGIRSLFGGMGHEGGFGGGGISGYGGPAVEETVVNNYYDSPGNEGRDDFGRDYSDAGVQDTDYGQDYTDASDADTGDYSDDDSGGDSFA
jgi:hypothetical protein